MKIFSVLAVLFLLTMPASAYEFSLTGGKNNAVVHINHISKSEVTPLMLFPQYAAAAVISYAKDHNVKVSRTKSSIAAEIRGHAMLLNGPNVKIYRNGHWRYTHEIADPMDIEMYKTEAWVYFLD
jgi:hypothetical protein